MKVTRESLRESIATTVKEWNVWFPFDYLWRKKYNVSFGSERHFNTSFFAMMYDLTEESTLQQVFKQLKEKEGGVTVETFVDGDTKKEILEMSDSQIEREFEDLDLSKY